MPHTCSRDYRVRNPSIVTPLTAIRSNLTDEHSRVSFIGEEMHTNALSRLLFDRDNRCRTEIGSFNSTRF